jgi:hypothetical protein
MRISWSGLANRASSCEAVWDLGERARFLVGRLERGSAEVGIDSGMGSDILMRLWSSVDSYSNGEVDNYFVGSSRYVAP